MRERLINDYDLVADLGDRLARVQVKTSVSRVRTPDGHERHAVRVATTGGNQSWTRLVKHFDPCRADFCSSLPAMGGAGSSRADAVEARTSIHLGGV